MTTPPSFPPPGQPPAPYGAPAPTASSFDWRRLLVGNWLGSAAVAGTTLLTALLLGLAVTLLVKPPGLGLGHVLEATTMLAAGAFGVRVGLSGGDDELDASGSAGIAPLTLTIIILLVAVVAFRRMVRAYPGPGPALADAARTALLVGLGLMLLAIVFRGDNEDLGDGYGSDLSADNGVAVDFGASIAGALFLGFLVTFVLLALVVVARRDWWSERVQGLHDRLAAPLYGYAVIVLLLPLVGLVGFLLLGFGEESLNDVEEETNLRELLTVVTILLGNGGVWLLGLGSGAGIGGRYRFEGGGEEESSKDYVRLWGEVTEEEPGLWASPVILVLVLALSAFLVVRRSRSRERALGNLAIWVGGVVVLVPMLVLLGNVRGSGEFAEAGEFGSGDYEASGVAGINGVEMTFFVLGIALVVALVVSLLTGTLTTDGLRSGLATVQSRPGQPGPGQPYPPQSYPAQPSPGQQPPTGPPTGPPPSAAPTQPWPTQQPPQQPPQQAPAQQPPSWGPPSGS